MSDCAPTTSVNSHWVGLSSKFPFCPGGTRIKGQKKQWAHTKKTRQASIRLHECVVLESNVDAGGEEKLENVRQQAAASQDIPS